MASLFYVLLFGTIFFATWNSFKPNGAFPAMMVLLFTLIFFSVLIPPMAGEFIMLFMAFVIGGLVFKLIMNKIQN